MVEQELKRRVSEALGKRDFLVAERLCHEAEGSVAAAELFQIRGAVYSAQGDLENALSALARAHQALPARGDIAYNYGVVLHQSGRIHEGIEAWKKATANAPQNAAAWVNLALATLQLGDAPTALDTYRRGLKYHPTHRDLLYNCANLLFRQGQLEEGESSYQELLKFHRNDAQAWMNYGKLLRVARRYSESESCYRQAIATATPADRPQAHFNLANLLLQQGKWQEGFAAYQWRLQLPGSVASPWNLPEWNAALPGGSRILLWNDQGQGDAIMFLRFAPLLAQRGYRLFAFVQSPLKTLTATVPGIEAALCPLDAPQDLDAALPLCSLPYALGLVAVDLWRGPYMSAPQPSVFPFAERPPAIKRVGIVWAGNPKQVNDANRSVDLAHFAPLFELPGLEWYSLQVGDRVADLASFPYRDRVRAVAPYLTDFSATASVLRELDLLISVDSAPAHLAGALGKPVWTLIPAIDTDWRWQNDGDTTFWYPTMRLFRRTRSESWSDVVAAIRDALAEIRPT